MLIHFMVSFYRLIQIEKERRQSEPLKDILTIVSIAKCVASAPPLGLFQLTWKTI